MQQEGLTVSLETEWIMSEDKTLELRVQCLLKEYEQSAESFRHTYATIWQSGVLFATFSVAIFGFFFSFQSELKSLPYLPYVALSSIILWWVTIFEPMNHYGDIRANRCQKIEEELSTMLPPLNMRQFTNYNRGKYKAFRVRWGVRILGVIIIVLMILLLPVLFSSSKLPVNPLESLPNIR
jgi:hypothetical protein